MLQLHIYFQARENELNLFIKYPIRFSFQALISIISNFIHLFLKQAQKAIIKFSIRLSFQAIGALISLLFLYYLFIQYRLISLIFIDLFNASYFSSTGSLGLGSAVNGSGSGPGGGNSSLAGGSHHGNHVSAAAAAAAHHHNNAVAAASAAALLVVPQPINASKMGGPGVGVGAGGGHAPAGGSGRKYQCKMCPQVGGSRLIFALHLPVKLRLKRILAFGLAPRSVDNESTASEATAFVYNFPVDLPRPEKFRISAGFRVCVCRLAWLLQFASAPSLTCQARFFLPHSLIQLEHHSQHT